MKLAQPFFRLPVVFDAGRLCAEIEALPASAWAGHPNEIEGNSSLRLISAGGGENDDVYGAMMPTPHLQRCLYIRQILASFGVVWSRSRLMRLDPHGSVPPHADINYQWFYRVRMHIPIVTRPEVTFHCDGKSVHMAAGEAWIFDNWRQHHVDNPTDITRIHLVADTSGTAAFWEHVAQSGSQTTPPRSVGYQPGVDAWPLTERSQPPVVMPPAEVELLLSDLRGELQPSEDSPDARVRLARYHWLLQSFCFDWRQVYALRGEGESGAAEYGDLVDGLRARSLELAGGLVMRTNGVAAHKVLEGRVLRHLLRQAPPRSERPTTPSTGGRPGATSRARFSRPVFIVAAPRSGSTLLYESLAVSPEFWSLGGEAHWLVESIPGLRPGSPGVDSNRLESRHSSDAVTAHIDASLRERLRDVDGRSLGEHDVQVRFLEKTPKNALRIPFFDRLFPDARFIFLWRDPRENISSIMEAWRAGTWTTYRELEGWDGPWSMLLPPGWQQLQGKPLEEIAAFQWDVTNRMVLDDLAALPSERWTTATYSTLVMNPRATLERLCEFAGIAFDGAVRDRASGSLPLSRYTNTPPESGKWRRNEAEVLRMLARIEPTWQRLRSLG